MSFYKIHQLKSPLEKYSLETRKDLLYILPVGLILGYNSSQKKLIKMVWQV